MKIVTKFIELLKGLGNHSQTTEKQNITVIDIDQIGIEVKIDKR